MSIKKEKKIKFFMKAFLNKIYFLILNYKFLYTIILNKVILKP
jgi:hypothetical protein